MDCFAIHGGTAINLFVQNLLRYSVDIDVTYIPIQPREESLATIKTRLLEVKEKIKTMIPGAIVQEKPNKLICIYQNILVKIEVNDVKRGIIADTVVLPLCKAVKEVFGVFYEAKIVPLTQLYGGKMCAALDRQHPRDLFDVKYMFEYIHSFDEIKTGFIFCLLSGDRPIVESLYPNLIDQKAALENQFRGMTDIPFTYDDYERIRQQLITFVNSNLKQSDKEFLVSYEEGNPLWSNSEYDYFKLYPSIQWKQLNINRLKQNNPTKHKQGIEKLTTWLKNN
jgi:hypothetical protein